MIPPHGHLHLSSPEGQAALAAVMRSRPLLAFDFDGTLAPIVARPEAAQVPRTVKSQLGRLASRLPLAVITGRSVSDVMPRLGFQPAFVIGNHGAENGQADLAGESAELLPLRARVRLRAQALRSAGVDVEDKGHSIAFHYRMSKDQAIARAAISSVLAGGNGDRIKVFGGKCVVNAVAQGAPDKADALEMLVQRCGVAAAVFVGDDVNDEAVFARAGRDWLTVKVGRDGLATQARYRLDDVVEVGQMLDRMLELTT